MNKVESGHCNPCDRVLTKNKSFVNWHLMMSQCSCFIKFIKSHFSQKISSSWTNTLWCLSVTASLNCLSHFSPKNKSFVNWHLIMTEFTCTIKSFVTDSATNMCNLFTMKWNMIVYTVIIRKLENKAFKNICNLFKMEFYIIVCNVTIRQLRYKAFDNMCNLFTMKWNMIVYTVIIWKIENKTFKNMCNLFKMEFYIVVCNVTIRQLR